MLWSMGVMDQLILGYVETCYYDAMQDVKACQKQELVYSCMAQTIVRVMP